MLHTTLQHHDPLIAPDLVLSHVWHLTHVNNLPSVFNSASGFPLLGADRGGLATEQVLTLMQNALKPVAEHIDVEIYLYRPDASDDLFGRFKKQLQQLDAQQLKLQTGITLKRLETLQQAVCSGRYAQINQLADLPGIGLKTLEQVFQFCQQPPPENISLF